MDEAPKNPSPPPSVVLTYADYDTDARSPNVERYLARHELESRILSLTFVTAIPAFLGAIFGVILLTFGVTLESLMYVSACFAPAVIAITQAIAVDKVSRSRAAVVVILVTTSLILVCGVGIGFVGVVALQLPGGVCYLVPVLAYDAAWIYLCVRVIMDAGKYLSLTRNDRSP